MCDSSIARATGRVLCTFTKSTRLLPKLRARVLCAALRIGRYEKKWGLRFKRGEGVCTTYSSMEYPCGEIKYIQECGFQSRPFPRSGGRPGAHDTKWWLWEAFVEIFPSKHPSLGVCTLPVDKKIGRSLSDIHPRECVLPSP